MIKLTILVPEGTEATLTFVRGTEETELNLVTGSSMLIAAGLELEVVPRSFRYPPPPSQQLEFKLNELLERSAVALADQERERRLVPAMIELMAARLEGQLPPNFTVNLLVQSMNRRPSLVEAGFFLERQLTELGSSSLSLPEVLEISSLPAEQYDSLVHAAAEQYYAELQAIG